MSEIARSVAIVGASLAGGTVAQQLRAGGYEGRITLVGAEALPPYERPELSKGILTQTTTVEALMLRADAAWADDEIELVLGNPVTRISSNERAIHVADGGVLVADRVVLCTGSRPRRVNVPGANLDGVLYLRTADDALAIREHLRPGRSVVIVGGGYIGAEVAAAARTCGSDVTMVEAAPRLMAQIGGAVVSRFFTDKHLAMGVKILTGTCVTGFQGDAHVTHVVTDRGERILADCVVVGVGADAVDALAAGAGIATRGGVIVDEQCRTSIEEVFAAGDVALLRDPYTGKRSCFGHYQSAQAQAAVVADALLGGAQTYENLGWFWSDQYDLRLQVAGSPRAGDSCVVRGDVDSGSFGTFFVRDGRLVAVASVNSPREFRTAMQLIERGGPVEAAALADENLELRSLLASTRLTAVRESGAKLGSGLVARSATRRQRAH